MGARNEGLRFEDDNNALLEYALEADIAIQSSLTNVTRDNVFHCMSQVSILIACPNRCASRDEHQQHLVVVKKNSCSALPSWLLYYIRSVAIAAIHL